MEANLDRLLMLASSYLALYAPSPPAGFTHIPLSLSPARFKRSSFEDLQKRAPLHNTLMLRVSLDTDYIYKALAEVCETDSFTSRLIELSRKAKNSQFRQDIFFGLTRNDFMFDQADQRFYQVEYNTIAASFVFIGSQVPKFHKHAGRVLKENWDILENDAFFNFAEAFNTVYKLYGQKGVVLFVVLNDEKNLFDQTGLDLALWEKGIFVVRASLLEIEEEAIIGENGELLFRGDEIAIAYFRSGYVPEHYHSEKQWKGREKIEMSRAVKCPNVDFHLAGCKKIQQLLSADSGLFVSDDREIRENFTEIFSFAELSELVRQRVRSDPGDWVLKPQREGGGNNIYGVDILPYLENFTEHKEFVIMKMIRCPENTSYMVRNGAIQQVSTVSEVGMFGAIVAKGDEVIVNEYSGYLVRTKSRESNEGGVAAGYGVIDSARLVD